AARTRQRRPRGRHALRLRRLRHFRVQPDSPDVRSGGELSAERRVPRGDRRYADGPPGGGDRAGGRNPPPGADHRLGCLGRLSTAMQAPLSLPEQLARVLEAARRVVAIDRFYIWAITPAGHRLAALAGAGFSELETKELEGAEIPLAESGAMYQAYREGAAL